jgi:hypothetical protein
MNVTLTDRLHDRAPASLLSLSSGTAEAPAVILSSSGRITGMKNRRNISEDVLIMTQHKNDMARREYTERESKMNTKPESVNPRPGAAPASERTDFGRNKSNLSLDSSFDMEDGDNSGEDGAYIQVRAYEIWEREGRPDGKALEHWLQAKREIHG